MEIIGTTKDGFIIQASKTEVEEILTSLNGVPPTGTIQIGQKIPGINYAGTIRNFRTLKNDTNYRNFMHYFEKFNDKVSNLTEVIDNLEKIYNE